MATYGEIVANRDWFVHEIAAVDAVAAKCLSANWQMSCMHIYEWPGELSAYKGAYDDLLENMSGEMSGESGISYATGSERLKAVAAGLHSTAKAYLTVEAENESAIRTQIDDLLRNF
jgi:hypothetical protein